MAESYKYYQILDTYVIYYKNYHDFIIIINVKSVTKILWKFM